MSNGLDVSSTLSSNNGLGEVFSIVSKFTPTIINIRVIIIPIYNFLSL